jgi:hypothetical protein
MRTCINRRSGGQRGRSPIPGCRPTRRYPVRMGDGSVGIASALAPSGLLRAAINLGNPVCLAAEELKKAIVQPRYWRMVRELSRVRPKSRAQLPGQVVSKPDREGHNHEGRVRLPGCNECGAARYVDVRHAVHG